MEDDKTIRYCEVVCLINDLNKEITNKRLDFYDGGTSFEECNKELLQEMKDLQIELKTLLKDMIWEK